MKIRKWLIALGMAGVIFFILMDLTGCLSWKGYNPVSDYISKILMLEAPNSGLTRTFLNAYNICFCLYALSMVVLAFQRYRISIRTGYLMLFLIALYSLFGYAMIPISLEFMFIANNLIHIVISISIFALTFFAILILSIGYWRTEQVRKLGKIYSIATVFYLFLNIWHIAAFYNAWNIFGLIERLTFYTFHALTFTVSLIYFREETHYSAETRRPRR